MSRPSVDRPSLVIPLCGAASATVTEGVAVDDFWGGWLPMVIISDAPTQLPGREPYVDPYAYRMRIPASAAERFCPAQPPKTHPT
jgi:hypothetical protein